MNAQSIFVAKYDHSGLPQWATQVNGTKYDVATGLVSDGQGSIYLTV